MNEKSVFNTGINYDSYFKKNVSQSGFNLRLTQLIKQIVKEAKDELYSDTFAPEVAFSSKEEILEWAKKQSKTPKGSDLIVVQSGPMSGTWRVKSEKLSIVDDLVKISGTSSASGEISAVYVKIGDEMFSPDENGVIDLTGKFQLESGETIVQVINSVQNELTEVTNEVESVKTTVQELSGITESLETTVNSNTEKVTKVEADLTEVHNKIDSVEETVSEFDSRISESESKSEQAISKVIELEPSVQSNTDKINYLDEKLDEDELSQLNDAIEITPDE